MESPLDAQRRLSAIDNPRGDSISFRREIYLHRRRGDRARSRRVVSDCRKPILAAAEHRTKHELSTAPKRPTDRPDRDLGPTSIIDLVRLSADAAAAFFWSRDPPRHAHARKGRRARLAFPVMTCGGGGARREFRDNTVIREAAAATGRLRRNF